MQLVRCCLLQSVQCQYLPIYRLLFLCHCVYCCLLQSVRSSFLQDVYYQYLRVHGLLVLCHYDHCCPLQSLHCLSVPHPVTLRLLCQNATPVLNISALCVRISHCTVCCFCVNVSTAVFYNLSTVCQYLTMYRLLVLCHYVHFYFPQSLQCLSGPLKVPSVLSVSLCPLLYSTISPLSVNTPHCTVI